VGVITTEGWNVLTTVIFHTFWNVLFERAFPLLDIDMDEERRQFLLSSLTVLPPERNDLLGSRQH